MKKTVRLFLISVLACMCVSCAAPAKKKAPDLEPQALQMKAICELAVMDCYYHNVAKWKEEDAQGMLWWKKDRHFWIEYSGIVTLGVDASLVDIQIEGTKVTVTLPEARILSCKVDSASLTKDSFVVEQGSADIKAEYEVKALEAAQSKLEETASHDQALLASARQRTQELLSGYLTNIGAAVGKNYTIEWIEPETGGNSFDAADRESKTDPASEASE